MMENEPEVNMLLAGDIGGTKTLIGLYEAVAPRPRKIASREFGTLEHEGLSSILRAFIAEMPESASARAATFGIAGPVLGRSASLTNVPWLVDADGIERDFSVPHVALINDLEAMAHGVTVVDASETCVLQEGRAHPTGNMAVIAAGTGLGEALLPRIGGRFVPCPSEGGHADFAARNENEFALARDLISRFGRAEIERVISGMGLINIHRVTHANRTCSARADERDPHAPAAISEAALNGTCDGCAEALRLFVDAYGAEAGNLALRCVATSGVYVGGGIAPKILPALRDGRFIDAFTDKVPFREILCRIPVRVVLNPEVGLLGAAVHALAL